jgi:hypothetical protein
MPKGGCDSCASKDPEAIRDAFTMTVSFVVSAGFDGALPYLGMFRGHRKWLHEAFTVKKPFEECWGGIYDA